MPIKSVVGVCGFGYSGSGAVLDLLKPYSDINVIDNLEFSLVYTPDGIEDLQRNISLYPSRYWSSDSAIRRFLQLTDRKRKIFDKLSYGGFSSLLSDYLNQLIQIEWEGSTSVHIYQEQSLSYFFKQRVLRRLISEYELRFKPFRHHFPPQKKMYYSYMGNDEFVHLSSDFIMRLLECMNTDKENETIVLDQPFSANNPTKSFPFFLNPKAIVVQRDPRDTYLLAKKNLGLCGSFVPTDNVDDFINYYNGLMASTSDKSDDRVLKINFEDLIYRYKETKDVVKEFVKCKKLKDNCVDYFNPKVSINNTQLWLKYDSFSIDIKKIEKSLSAYLYDFSKFNIKPSFTGQSF